MTKDSAKTIVCYGDSNTWGAKPGTEERWPRSVRWTGVLQKILGEDYEVINEGLCGRTLVAEDPTKIFRTGITHFDALLQTHDPIDYVIIMLGTNDIKTTYNLTAEQIAAHLDQTLCLAKETRTDTRQNFKILVVCPPQVIQPADGKLDERMVRGPELMKALPTLFQKVSEKHEGGFINAGEYVSCGSVDGYHLDESGHKKLGEVLAGWIQKN